MSQFHEKVQNARRDLDVQRALGSVIHESYILEQQRAEAEQQALIVQAREAALESIRLLHENSVPSQPLLVEYPDGWKWVEAYQDEQHNVVKAHSEGLTDRQYTGRVWRNVIKGTACNPAEMSYGFCGCLGLADNGLLVACDHQFDKPLSVKEFKPESYIQVCLGDEFAMSIARLITYGK